MGQISKGATGVSLLVGVATGGILGTLAGKCSPPESPIGSKLLHVSLATAVTAAIAWGGFFGFGSFFVLSGGLAGATLGTVASFAIEEAGQYIQKFVDARATKVNKRY